MKKSYILFISLFALLLSGCSKDYLNTAPTSSISGSAIFESTDNMKMAINGLNKLLCKQWFSSQGWNGQGTTMLYYGEYPGDELTVYLTGWVNTICGYYHDSDNATYTIRPWHMYYMIIGNANSIIAKVDAATGTDADKAFIKAQALTYRAYSYYYLTQLYGKRWMDSSNGASDGVVLRLDESTGDMPLSTLGECYAQIYQDLDDAIANFKASGSDRKNTYEMGIEVAYSVYTRIALAKQDWQKAYDMATNLLKSNSYLMSTDEYVNGFCHANKEWIWYLVGNETEDLYFFSFAAYMGWNVQASQCRTYPKCMSKQIYEQIPSTDIRKAMFLDPGDMSYTAGTGKVDNSKNKQLYNYAYEYAKERDFLNGHVGFPVSTFTPYVYMQFKFQRDAAVAGTAITDVPLIRTSEILLNRAEAACMLGKVSEAKADMTTLVKTSGRDPEYDNSALTKDELLDQIKLYTRIELWGEGFNWFNLKRWGDTIERKSFSNGGSWFDAVAVTIGPNEPKVNEWVWVIPLPEKNYNHAL